MELSLSRRSSSSRNVPQRRWRRWASRLAHKSSSKFFSSWTGKEKRRTLRKSNERGETFLFASYPIRGRKNFADTWTYTGTSSWMRWGKGFEVFSFPSRTFVAYLSSSHLYPTVEATYGSKNVPKCGTLRKKQKNGVFLKKATQTRNSVPKWMSTHSTTTEFYCKAYQNLPLTFLHNGLLISQISLTLAALTFSPLTGV